MPSRSRLNVLIDVNHLSPAPMRNRIGAPTTAGISQRNDKSNACKGNSRTWFAVRLLEIEAWFRAQLGVGFARRREAHKGFLGAGGCDAWFVGLAFRARFMVGERLEH